MLGHVFLGRYQAVRLLGEGGMGQVYLAKQVKPPSDRQVVVKVMREELAANPKVREVFQREMDFMARFRHPHAVSLLEASTKDPKGPCIIMEYIPGVTLESLLEKHRRLGVLRVGRMLGQLCQALQAAHKIGIVHRDLKPANIMVVDPDTPNEKIKVMDFGLAKLDAVPHIPLEKLNDPGAFLACGTPEYICPEQCRGDEVDYRGDLYSVGVMLFEMLTGRRPFESKAADMEGVNELLFLHAEQRPPRFADVGATLVPPEVEAVVQACLAKYPNERPQTAHELAERFEKALGEKILDKADPAAETSSVILRPEPKRVDDLNATVTHLDAWMPERIAVVKLRGFVHDLGGEVVESIPGLIRVRFGLRGPNAKQAAPSLLSWLGLGRKEPEAKPVNGIAMELHMEKKDAGHQSLLHITVVLRPEAPRQLALDPAFKARCERILVELRAYLIGSQH